MKIPDFIVRLCQEEDGPTAVEYAVMISLILGVIVATVVIVGTETNTMFEMIGDEFDARTD